MKRTKSARATPAVGAAHPVGAAVALPLPLAVGTLLLLACLGCGHNVDLEAAGTFQEAQKTFDQADSPDDFLRAAGLYQRILDRGIVSGALLFNQGNAYMQAGQRGRAVAAYRRAKRYRPRDAYLDANLRYARGSENPGGRRPVIEYLLFWQNWLSYPEKFRLAAAAAYATFAFGLVALFWRRRLFSRLAVAGVALTLLFAFSAGYDWYRYDAVVHGVIIDDEVTARKGNATGYEPAFTEPLTEGTGFRLVERRGDWLLIRLPAGQEGWVEDSAAVLY